jgi:RimJ/RimL family protein N-acetyltransferase
VEGDHGPVPRLVPPHLAPGAVAGHEQPAIDAGSITLRPFDAADAPWLVSVYQDPDIQRWHLLRLDSVREAEDWIARENHAWRTETDVTWLVADTETGERLGRISLRTIDLRWGVAGIGYWVAADARGRGVARSALIALTRWAIDDLGLHRLTVNHSTQNPASCRVAASAGYTDEGVARSEQRHQDSWHDKHMHAFVAGDPSPSRRSVGRS